MPTAWRSPYDAHGRRFAAATAPAAYIAKVARAKPLPATLQEPLSSRFPHVASDYRLDLVTDASDTAILGLRLNEGLDLVAFERRYGVTLDTLAGPALNQLVEWGLLERAQRRLRLTPRGRLLSNEVFLLLLPGEMGERRVRPMVPGQYHKAHLTGHLSRH